MLVWLLLLSSTANASVNNNNKEANTIKEVDKSPTFEDDELLAELEESVLLLPGIQMSPRKVKGTVDDIGNFTLTSTLPVPQTICWETNNNYLTVIDPEVGKNYSAGNFCVEVLHDGETTVFFSSSLLGIYNIRFYVLEDEVREYLVSDDSPQLVIRRSNENMNTFVTIFFSATIGLAIALMGLDIDLKIVADTFKRPIGPAVGMFSQFIVMPVFSYFIGWLLLETTYERLGLLLLGCAPGGAASNFWTAMYKGDVNLSCTMTFLSSCFSFAFTTLWVYVLGTPLVGKDIPIPYLRLVISLASFTLPLIIGVGYKHFFPKSGELLKKKVSRPFFLFCLLIMPAIGIWNNIYFFYLCEWTHLISGALLGIAGYTMGAGLAFVFRMGKPQIIAISLETAFQNGGIAFIILNLTFPSPYREMGIMPILGFFFLATGPIMMIVYAVYVIVKRVFYKDEFTEVNQEDPAVLRKL